MRRYALFIVLALAIAACGGGAQGGEQADGVPDLLRIGLIPNVAPDEQRAQYQPFAEYMEERLGTEVELFVATDYAGVVNALANDRLDLAYLGAVTYLQAEQQGVELEPLVSEIDEETGTVEYNSAIVVRDDSPFQSIEDLFDAGASFAFGDIASTSGSMYPRMMLVDAGAECSAQVLDSCPPLGQIIFSGGHDATARGVLAGNVDAGGLELRILRRLEREGTIPEGELRIIATRGVIGYPWVARKALGDDVVEEIRQAFLDIDDPALLDLMRAVEFATVTSEDYDELRVRSVELGLVN